MKKYFFGVMLFFSGFIGMLTIIVLEILKPALNDNYSSVTIKGLNGFLKDHNLTFLFILFIFAIVIGLIICGIEAFSKKI